MQEMSVDEDYVEPIPRRGPHDVPWYWYLAAIAITATSIVAHYADAAAREGSSWQRGYETALAQGDSPESAKWFADGYAEGSLEASLVVAVLLPACIALLSLIFPGRSRKRFVATFGIVSALLLISLLKSVVPWAAASEASEAPPESPPTLLNSRHQQQA
jgi:hypothetical protein